jgi:uncharacterized protein DUF3131
MQRFNQIRSASAIALVLLLAACGSGSTSPDVTDPGTPGTPGTPGVPTENDVYLAGARTAWTYFEKNTQSSTGLAGALPTFPFTTAWDIASQIGATYSAHELGIINDATYDGRISKILATLRTVPLFDGVAFHRFYDSRNGQPVNAKWEPSTTGFGWSATDIGRLLIWLRILAVNQPQYSAQATAIVQRLNFSRLISGGVLRGMNVDANGNRSSFAETGIGYEQYAAAGFALWGQRATTSLDATAYTQPKTIRGVTVNVDSRGSARLISEPYIMMGLEIGWYASPLKTQAQALLAVQQARYDQTGILTMPTEDAMPDPPYYFYYYSIYQGGNSFVVEGPDKGSYVPSPKWVSSKAAFAWRALFPTDYTSKTFNAVQPAAIPGDGWGAGVYEGSLNTTGYTSLNTAGVILEAAAYRKRGQPFLSQAIN